MGDIRLSLRSYYCKAKCHYCERLGALVYIALQPECTLLHDPGEEAPPTWGLSKNRADVRREPIGAGGQGNGKFKQGFERISKLHRVDVYLTTCLMCIVKDVRSCERDRASQLRKDHHRGRTHNMLRVLPGQRCVERGGHSG